MTDQPSDQSWPTLCHRCGLEVTVGEGSFFVVRIESLADPTPPSFPGPSGRPGETMEQLLRELSERTEQELMDQVHRRLTIILCAGCHARWIEDPAGSR